MFFPHKSSNTKLITQQMLCSESCFEGKNKLLFIFCKQNSIFISQNFNLPHFYEIGQKLVMIFPKNSGHELINIKIEHIFISISIHLANISGNFLNFSPIIHKINIDDSILRIEYILILFAEKPSFKIFLMNYTFQLFLFRLVYFNILIKNEYE